MKTMTTRFLTVLTAIWALNFISFAQKAERLDFSKNCCGVWEQKVPANSSKDFVFYAKKGQKLTISFMDDTNVGSMDLGKYSIEPNAMEPFEMVIEVSKDYTLSVSNNSNKATSFRFAISLEYTNNPSSTSSTNSSDNSPSERVQFKKGESSAMLTREIPANGSIDFIINARKGQTMDFTIGYDFKDSDVEAFLTEPGLQDISLSSGPKAPNEFVIEITGDHRLTVNNMTQKKITITLYLDID